MISFFCKTLFFICLPFSCLTNICTAQSSDKRPNILYIMVDDMGYADLSCYGRKDYRTPNLDKLAKQGMKFTDAYAAAPVCTPTRAAFMTGRYPARIEIGLQEPLTIDSTIGLTAATPSLPTLLKQSGYETVLIGKWHLGYAPQHAPNANGFDYFFGIRSGEADYFTHKARGKYDLHENENFAFAEGYLTELLSAKAISFLKQKHQKPFFLSLQFTAPHWPWQGPDDKGKPVAGNGNVGGTPAVYAAMMKSLDDEIGKIMSALDKANLSKNTVVIFTSDNGGEKFSDMGALSGEKMSLKEGGIREPAFIRWPGKIDASSTTNQMAITMDWTATILALASAQADKNFPLDGKNLLPLLTGKKKAEERTFYWRTYQATKQKAIREGKWKYLQIEADDYLFDVVADPGEKQNLKEQHPEIYQRLKAKYS